jgi:hypothetical protein
MVKDIPKILEGEKNMTKRDKRSKKIRGILGKLPEWKKRQRRGEKRYV